MLNCPICGNHVVIATQVLAEFDIYTVVQRDKLKVILRGICDVGLSDIEEKHPFFCPSCKKIIESSNLVIRSALTGNNYTLNNCVIIYIKCPEQDNKDNKIKVVSPPAVIGKEEVEAYTKHNNYYGDANLVVVKPISDLKIDLSFLQQGD